MTEEIKTKMFEKLLELEHKSEKVTYDHRNYFEQANGAFEMLRVLGIDREYIRWSEGKW